jgi:transporter family-2 protein
MWPCPQGIFISTKKENMNTWYILLAIAAGAVLSIQVGVNSVLRQGIGSPIIAALISFLVGTVFLLGYAFVTRAAWPTTQALAKLPLWAWLGGALGAYYVATAIVVAPKLGAANVVCLMIAAQLITALLLDHYGLVGFAQHGINPARIAGALLLVAGAVMIVKY